MLYHPEFDPIAVHLGPIAVRWYGLMYLVGFATGLILGRARIRANQNPPISIREFDDLLFYIILGVIVGGRLGYALIYDLAGVLHSPISILYVWKGGMSFHGGLIGVCVAVALYARFKQKNWLVLTDFVAPLAPLGLAAGRIGNFINGDLLASGTISGPDTGSYGSMLEISWQGTKPVQMPDGSERKFIQDHDTVIMRAKAEKNGVRIGFGEVRSKVLPAL